MSESLKKASIFPEWDLGLPDFPEWDLGLPEEMLDLSARYSQALMTSKRRLLATQGLGYELCLYEDVGDKSRSIRTAREIVLPYLSQVAEMGVQLVILTGSVLKGRRQGQDIDVKLISPRSVIDRIPGDAYARLTIPVENHQVFGGIDFFRLGDECEPIDEWSSLHWSLLPHLVLGDFGMGVDRYMQIKSSAIYRTLEEKEHFDYWIRFMTGIRDS